MPKTGENKRIDFVIDMLFHMSHENDGVKSVVKTHTTKHSNDIAVEVSANALVKRSFTPNHPWLLNFGAGLDSEESDSRLFCESADHLVCDVRDILGGGFEYVAIHGLSLKWMKALPTDMKRLRGVSALGATDTYEVHERDIYLDREGKYHKAVSALNGNKPTNIFIQGMKVNQPLDDIQLFMLSSIKEDFYRQGVFHVRITKLSTNQGLRMAVDYESVKELMAFRQKPCTKTGRKKPIIHWVKEHSRKVASNKPITLDKFKRGLGEFEVDGYKIKIEQPECLLHEFPQYKSN